MELNNFIFADHLPHPDCGFRDGRSHYIRKFS